MSDNTPDFDKMSPEELMKWMETLAKRQGAYEGFTTTADMDVAEVDPDSVVIDEPGYVPYGQENKKPEDVKPKPAAPAPAAVPTPPAVSPIPAPPPPVVVPAAAASATPDFDSMSPEELMSWMETLAKRQGAYEGFTTSADMDIAEIDPDTVVIDEPGYVPFEGKEPKARPAAAAPTPAPTPVAPPLPAPAPIPVVAAAPPPPPADVPAAASAETPDFDKMSPEEIMKWMETLAKRQGAYEGFTTTADMNIAEVDPNSVPNDEPGYVPFEGKAPKARPADAAPAPAPKPIPVAPPPPAMPVAPAATVQPVGQDALDWLEKLAADPAGNELPALDFSGLGDLADAPAMESENTLGWLEGLAQGGTVDLSSFESGPAVPASAGSVGDDPMAWLENLASNQSADEMTLPSAEFNEPEFSLDSILAQADEPAANVFPTSDDPAAWLDSLAEQRSGIPPQAPPPVVTSAPPAAAAAKAESAEIMSALNSGKEVDPNDIAAFFGNMMNIAANRDDVQDYTFDPEDDAEVEAEGESDAIQGQIPDWLQAAAPVPQTDVPDVVPASLFVEDFVPPVVDDMPDWLKEETVTDESGLENIFASVSSVPDFSPPTTKVETPAINIPSAVKEEFLNTDDQWIETFELEYRERVGDVEAPAAVASSVSAPSAASDLPEETELSEGEPVALPDWLLSAASAAPVEDAAAAVPDWLAEPADQAVSLDWITDEPAPVVQEAVVSDLPDWLSEAAESTPDVPDWLLEPVEEPVAFVPPPAPVAAPAAPAIVPALAPKPVPAPAPVRQGFPAAAVDVSGVLGSAREKVAAGDVDNGLVDYESVVRAGGDLEEVIAELRSLMSRNPNNPAVYRVLGDALMRGGRLQEALDTYRKALNLL